MAHAKFPGAMLAAAALGGCTQKDTTLEPIYESKMLAEAVDYGETETIPPTTGR